MSGADEPPAVRGALAAWAQHHTGIVTVDFEADIGFYREQLGFELEFRVDGMEDRFARIVGVPGVSCDLAQLRNPATGARIELIATRGVPDGSDPSLPVHAGIAHTAYLVHDLEAAVALVIAAGGRMLGDIVEFDEGPAAYLRTPGGTVIEIEQPNDRNSEGGE